MLKAYSGRDLQHAGQIMERCAKAGLDIKGCIKATRNQYGVQGADQQALKQMPKCPECGGVLQPVINYEGLKIMGCGSCKYSEVVK